MMSYEIVMQMADQLSLSDKARLIEHISASLSQALELEAYRRMPWHEFIELTAGSLAESPIERPPQPPYEEREALA